MFGGNGDGRGRGNCRVSGRNTLPQIFQRFRCGNGSGQNSTPNSAQGFFNQQNQNSNQGPGIDNNNNRSPGNDFYGFWNDNVEAECLGGHTQWGDENNGNVNRGGNGAVVGNSTTENCTPNRRVDENDAGLGVGGNGNGNVLEEDSSSPTAIDRGKAKWWIYPKNVPVRDYQLNIVKTALFHNTLVCLPTGLGKTLIAAVVMYNFYNWFPNGKIIFMAPTKPLVDQQLEACLCNVAIAEFHTAEMTGSSNAESRRPLWESKRVFFCTPQVVDLDIAKGVLDPKNVICIVVDECHKTIGNYAYVNVIDQLKTRKIKFRVLGLSATPGGNVPKIQAVIHNLMVAKVEYRDENDHEVHKYTHSRVVETITVSDEPQSKECFHLLDSTLLECLSPLIDAKVYHFYDVERAKRYSLLQAMERMNSNRRREHTGKLALQFMKAIFLASLRECLECGFRTTLDFINAKVQEKTFVKIMMNDYQGLATLHATLENMVHHAIDHPRIRALNEVLAKYFEGNAGGARAIVFSSLKGTVNDIVENLVKLQGIVTAKKFIGQGGGSVKAGGMRQSEQKKVLQEFREGKFNTLVATCIGEEGLDIPEVGLIVCFDGAASPIRDTQRKGRTGRHGQGKVVYLLAEGKEREKFDTNQKVTQRVNRQLREASRNFDLFQRNPRMVPREFAPQMLQVHMNTNKREDLQCRTSGKGKRGRGRGSKSGARNTGRGRGSTRGGRKSTKRKSSAQDSLPGTPMSYDSFKSQLDIDESDQLNQMNQTGSRDQSNPLGTPGEMIHMNPMDHMNRMDQMNRMDIDHGDFIAQDWRHSITSLGGTSGANFQDTFTGPNKNTACNVSGFQSPIGGAHNEQLAIRNGSIPRSENFFNETRLNSDRNIIGREVYDVKLPGWDQFVGVGDKQDVPSDHVMQCMESGNCGKGFDAQICKERTAKLSLQPASKAFIGINARGDVIVKPPPVGLFTRLLKEASALGELESDTEPDTPPITNPSENNIQIDQVKTETPFNVQCDINTDAKTSPDDPTPLPSVIHTETANCNNGNLHEDRLVIGGEGSEKLEGSCKLDSGMDFLKLTGLTQQELEELGGFTVSSETKDCTDLNSNHECGKLAQSSEWKLVKVDAPVQSVVETKINPGGGDHSIDPKQDAESHVVNLNGHNSNPDKQVIITPFDYSSDFDYADSPNKDVGFGGSKPDAIDLISDTDSPDRKVENTERGNNDQAVGVDALQVRSGEKTNMWSEFVSSVRCQGEAGEKLTDTPGSLGAVCTPIGKNGNGCQTHSSSGLVVWKHKSRLRKVLGESTPLSGGNPSPQLILISSSESLPPAQQTPAVEASMQHNKKKRKTGKLRKMARGNVSGFLDLEAEHSEDSGDDENDGDDADLEGFIDDGSQPAAEVTPNRMMPVYQRSLLGTWSSTPRLLKKRKNTRVVMDTPEATPGSGEQSAYESSFIEDGDVEDGIDDDAVDQEDVGSDASVDACTNCGKGGDLILCDGCDKGFHTKCVALMTVPEGDWFCPGCKNG